MTFSKQNVDENTEYKPGQAISLEDRTISVKFDSTLCLNSEGKLSCVSSGSGGSGIEYSEGEGIHISNHKISANVDGTTIKFNDQNQLTAIGGGSASYTAGDGISITETPSGQGPNIISVNKQWLDIRDATNPDGTFQLQNVSTDSSKQDIRLCVVEARPANGLTDNKFFTQTLGLNPDYELNFATSVTQVNVNIDNVNNADAESSNYLLSINDIPNDLTVTGSNAEFLRIHLPNSIKDEHEKEIDSITCTVKRTKSYKCNIDGAEQNIISFTEVGADFDFKHMANIIDETILATEDAGLNLCDADANVLIEFRVEADNKFRINSNVSFDEDLDMQNATFHFDYEKHKEVFNDKIILQVIDPLGYEYKTITFSEFEIGYFGTMMIGYGA